MRKVVIVGCGGRGKAHAGALAKEPRAKVVALADARRESAEAMDAEYGFGAAIYDDHRRMLEIEQPEVVVIALWTPLHLPVFKDCIAAGVKAVLSEKPMAPTWGECREMARLAEENGVQLTFSHQRRFATGNRLARDLIAEGRFGTIERLDLYSPPNLLDCGTHTFDQAMSFLGETPAKWVLAAVDTSKLVRWFDVSAEGMAIGSIAFENGVRASFQVGGPDLDMWSGVRLYGSEGHFAVLWDGQFRTCLRYDDPSWSAEPKEDTQEDHMEKMVHEVFDCQETGAESEVSARKALRAAEIIFGCYESVRRHERVDLPLTGVEDNPFLSMLAAGAFER
ncbi:Gfo/Idh/MocA family oxidoreductase [soil metagenome]